MQILIFFILMFIGFFAIGETAINDAYVAGNIRKEAVQQLVLHTTGGPDCNPSRSFRGGSLDTIVAHFLKNQQNISIHYVIDRDGKIVRMVPESMVAYHVLGHNENSIGIELINNGDGKDPFPDAQIISLNTLLQDILYRYKLAYSNIKSHSELDDSYLNCNGKKIKRKQDPGPFFPWVKVQNELELKTVALDEKQPDQSNKKIQPVEKTDNKDENKDHSILSKKSSETDLSKNQKSQLLEQKCRDSQAEFDSLKMQIADLEHQKITLQMELDDLKQQRVKFSKASPDSGIREGRFIIYNNGTIRDLNARLMWAASDNQEDINWFQAVRYVKELQLGGYSDWRLPKMNELEQLFQTGNNNRQPSLGCSGGYGITNGFHLSCDVLWSADRKNDGAYALDFISGKPRYDNPSGSGHRRVLPVRSD